MSIKHLALLTAIILVLAAYLYRPHINLTMARAPVYYISHGGPPSLFTPGSPPYEAWKKTGSRIRQEVNDGRVKGLVCVSAHWEADGKEIEVNSNTSNPLIYDFYNFPKHYYDEKFTSSFSPSTLQAVLSALSTASLPSTTLSRGLDHGLWVPFKAMFAQEPKINGNANTEGCGNEMPQIIQLSLPRERSGVEECVKLGKALSLLRDQGYAIVATGQPVHNLRAYMMSRSGSASPSSAFSSFLSSVHKTITTTPSSSLIQGVTGLMALSTYKSAHPTDEHFLPLVVAAAAAAPQDGGKEEVLKVETLLKSDEGALGWYIARWE